MEDKFGSIVEHIFNNWTGLQLAIENGMGGPNTSQVMLDFKNYVIQYCLGNQNIAAYDIQEVLEDILDEEFQTICEDNSPAEIAKILHRFLSLLKEGNIAQCEMEYQALPTCQLQLSKPLVNSKEKHQKEAAINLLENIPNKSSSSVPMEEDSEWTEVKCRRKK